MSLTVEDGTGVAGADAYASVAAVDAYWSARPHRAQAASWAALVTAQKEGCIREAAASIDAYDEYFRGIRRGWVQGLCWPRSEAFDDAGFPLPDLPPALIAATAELAVRASSQELRADVAAQSERVASVSAGSVSVTFAGSGSTTNGDGSTQTTQFTAAMDLLAPLMDRRGWAWS